MKIRTFFFLLIIYIFINTCAVVYGMKLTEEEKVTLYKAQQEMNKNNLKKAQEIIITFLDKNQDKDVSPELYLYLGNSYYDRDQYKKSAQTYSEGLKDNPENISLILNFAVSSYRCQNYQEAGTYFHKAYLFSKKEQRKPELLFKSATAFYRAKMLNKANENLNKLLDSNQNTEEKWLKLLIRINYELKKWPSLEENIHSFLKMEPTKSEYWRLLAQAYLEQEKYVQAASILEIVHSLFPATKDDLKQLANLYLYIDDPEKAANILEKVYGNNPDSNACERLAQLYFRSLHYKKALSFINKALEKETTAKRYFMQGEFYYRNRQYNKALQAYQESVRLDPEQGKTYLFLGFAANEVGELQLAKKAFQKASRFDKYKTWAKANVSSIEELLALKSEE